MDGEVVICKGRVVGVNASSTYNAADGSVTYDPSTAMSMLVLDPGVFSTDVDYTGQVVSSGAMYLQPKHITVKGALEFGEEYEFVMRPAKKEPPAMQAPGGPHVFKEED